MDRMVEASVGASPNFVVRASNVPLEFFEDREIAKKYFRRFGKVKLIMFKPKRLQLIIEYTNEDSMLNALEIAGEYNGKFFQMERDTTIEPIRKKRSKKDPDPDWIPDPEVRSELEALGAFRRYDLRPEAMAVDPPEPALANTKRKWKSASPKPTKKKSTTTKEASSIEQADLMTIIKQQAHSIDEKFRILDARDKLIRIKLKRNLEVSKVAATVGTCPDMCPEKERLLREIQHQVALYEQEDGGRGMNPRLAVKQYSRSSADQEAPLPQELRPVSVLQMTMGYLLHRIISQCDSNDVNIGEWYHFLWDRTRGIRKDITQQELCCQGSVELVEQCARFHIVCSARLVAEDPSVFDQKINTENLTKCLQTLKYMYHDLQLKGESCKNEAEFRAYIILLNLNDGNFMWEVQQLRQDIQESKAVKFALDVYSSLDKNNYVKFFNLVNSTTYLNACILMRYFIQVRLSALKILLKCYSPRISQALLPISYLMKILAFESMEATIEFLETYGLSTNVERTRIILDKHSFATPEYPFVLDRAFNLIESKRQTSIGEVVCGKELPLKIFETHIPNNSFDSRGYLKDSEVDLSDEGDNVGAVKDKEVPKIVFKPIEETPKPQKPAEIITSTPIVAKPSTFPPKPVIQSSIFAPIEPKTTWIAPKPTSIFTKSIFGAETVTVKPPIEVVVKNQQEETAKIEMEHKRRLEEELRKRREEEAELRRKIEERQRKAEMERKLLQEKLQQLEEAKRAESERRRRYENQQRILLEERQKAMEIKQGVYSVIVDLLDQVEERLKNEKLDEILQKMRNRKLIEVVTKWKGIARKKRKRKAIDFRPQWGGSRTVAEEAKELKTRSQNLTLASMKRYRHGLPLEIPIDLDDEIPKINLTDLTYQTITKKYLELNKKLPREMFWKVTISLPNEIEFRYGLNHVEKTLNRHIQWKERNSGAVLIQQSKTTPPITYCLEKQKGAICPNRSDSHGFIFIGDSLTDALVRRIEANLKDFGNLVRVAIVLVLQNYENPAQLKLFIENNEIVSDYLVIVDKFTTSSLPKIIEEALVFLTTRIEKTPPLEMDTLHSFLSKYLAEDLWKRANSFAKWNSNYKNCLKNPATVIYLYNEALNRLKAILLDGNCKEYAKFPDFFTNFLQSEIPDSLPCDYRYFPQFWDNPTYLKHIERVLNGLKLPNFLETWPPRDQVELELTIKNYCQMVFKQPQKSFYKVMSVVLWNFQSGEKFTVESVLWTDIIEVLVGEKLNETNFSLYGTGFVNKSIYNQLIAVYDVNSLNDHLKSDWFYVNNPVIKHRIQELLQEEKEEFVMEEQGDLFDDDELDVDKMMEKLLNQPRDRNLGKMRNDLNDCKKLLNDLTETLEIEKRIFEKSGEILKTTIDGN